MMRRAVAALLAAVIIGAGVTGCRDDGQYYDDNVIIVDRDQYGHTTTRTTTTRTVTKSTKTRVKVTKQTRSRR